MVPCPQPMWSSFCTSEKPKHERSILSWAPNDPLRTSLILWVDNQKEASLKRRYQILSAPWQTLGDIPSLKSLIIPRICQNKTDDPSVMEKTSLKVHLEVKKTSNFSTDFPTKGQRVCQNIGEGQVEHGGNRMDSNLTVGGYEIPKEQMCGCCVQLHQGFYAENFLGCKVKMWVYLKVLYMTSYFLFFVEQLDFSKTTNKRCPDLGHLDFQVGDSSGVFTLEWFSHKISPWHVPGWPTGTQPSLLRLSIHIGTAQ